MKSNIMNKIAFRVDSSSFIGIGHIKRCINIAIALKEFGIESIFISRNLPKNNYNDITDMGFKLCILESPKKIPNDTRDSSSWLCVDWIVDANETINKLNELGCRFVFVDHYAIALEWESYVKDSNFLIGVLDDLDREHNANILIDYSFWKETKDFEYLVNKRCVKLIGKTFMPLSNSFKGYSLKTKNFCYPTILISLGGFDFDGLALKSIIALNKLCHQNIKKVIIVTDIDSEIKLKEVLQGVSFKYDLHISPNGLGSIYEESDICLGAAGVSSFERVYFEIPQLIFVKADNQIETAKHLNQKNMAMVIKDFTQNNISKYIDDFIKEETLIKISKNLLNFIDLDGAVKIAKEINAIIEYKNVAKD